MDNDLSLTTHSDRLPVVQCRKPAVVAAAAQFDALINAEAPVTSAPAPVAADNSTVAAIDTAIANLNGTSNFASFVSSLGNALDSGSVAPASALAGMPSFLYTMHHQSRTFSHTFQQQV